ncbi:MAG: GDSL-type esterase/lipase family protein, partial [Sphingobacterium sp.]
MTLILKRLLLLCLQVLLGLSVYGQTKTRVASIGDSVTEGKGLENSEENSYPATLAKLLGSNYEVKNFGHSGATLLRNGHRPYNKTKQFKDALTYKADIAVIHLGLNDTDPRNFPHFRNQFISDYLWLIDTLRQDNPKIKIFICQMSPIFTGHPRFSSSTFDWYHALQKQITHVANTRDLPIIDLYTALHNRPDLVTDAPTLHPNVAGATLIAQTVYQHITGNFGDLKLPSVFGKYMVVQRDKPLKIWGTANAGTCTSVIWDGHTQHTTVSTDGHWELTFPAPKLSPKSKTLIVENGQSKFTFDQVLVGDVWLAAGQSNMGFRLHQAFRGDSLADASGTDPNIRLLQFETAANTDNTAWDSLTLQKANELEFFSGTWHENNRKNAENFSAIGYAFANEISREVNVPIGIISLAVGGSPQLAWLPRLTLESNPTFVQSLHPWRQSDYLTLWCRERAMKNLELSNSAFQQHPYAPSYIYQAGVAPMVPFSIRGIIWYQGESDADNAELYQKLFPAFVKSVRQAWHDDLPFYYTQLSSIERQSWPHFRNVQRLLLRDIPNSGMAVSSDIGNPNDVHPKEKIIVAKRLAQWALSNEYDKSNIPSGPLYKSYKVIKNIIEVDFDYKYNLQTNDGSPVRGFAFQRSDGKFMVANAQIVDDRVHLEMPRNSKLMTLVYGWDPVSRG